MLLFAIVCVGIGHNGNLHSPGESSAVLVGPSLLCNECFLIGNYGLNFVHRVVADGTEVPLQWNTDYFPVCFGEQLGGRLVSVADIGSEFAYIVDNVVTV